MCYLVCCSGRSPAHHVLCCIDSSTLHLPYLQRPEQYERFLESACGVVHQFCERSNVRARHVFSKATAAALGYLRRAMITRLVDALRFAI